ncbi:MAG: serine/threonine-protein kinase [bacterium]
MDKKLIDNRYVPIREIGAGGFALVIKAWASNLERFVAVKKVHENFSKNAKFLDMFRVEAISTAKLDHQNIVRVIDFLKTATNKYYIIMEYVKGADLRYLLQKCIKRKIKIPYGISAYIIGEVLKGLEFAYSHIDEITGEPLRIVHRDISPGNIMIYYDGRVKLGDFGIAKVSSSLTESFDAGKLRGKVPYMSPEQAEGTLELDNRSDIFSIGIVLYELITGKKLFEAASEYDTWKMVKKVKFNPRSLDVHSTAPEPLKAILIKSLMKNRNERYQSAKDMYKDIYHYLGEEEYNIQRENFKKFMSQVLADEIKIEEKETGHPVIDDIEIEETPVMQELPSKQTEAFRNIISEDKTPQPSKNSDEAPMPHEKSLTGEKTVIDFVLDTAKKYEKIFYFSLVAVFFLILILFAADVYFTWTHIGTQVHDRIWPPALVVDSYPSGAEINLKGIDGRNVLAGNSTTPFRMESIIPGNYLLVLKKDGYNEMSRKISVIGSKTEILDGSHEVSDLENNFVIKFETTLQINSTPPGADIYIDGKKLVKKTPAAQDIEAGQRLLSLSKSGFEPLGSMKKVASFGQCIINLAEPIDSQKGIDNRFWELNKSMQDGKTIYLITGTFWKQLDINSNPQDAEVFINNEQLSIGKTPLNKVSFQVGTHTITVRLPGFKSQNRTIIIDENTKESTFFSLNKIVTFSAYGTDSTNTDINARVTISGTNIKNMRTPFETDLPLKKLEAVFSKEPRYNSVKQTFNVQDVRNISAKLQLKNPFLKVMVIDENSGSPISNATIISDGKYIGTTDKKGEWQDYLSPGEHTIKVNTNTKYPEKEVTKNFEVASRETITFNLSAVADGQLIIDTKPHFVGAQIYIDGKYEGDTFRRISDLTRGTHKVWIEHVDLEKRAEKTIKFTQPAQKIILKLDEGGEFIIQ